MEDHYRPGGFPLLVFGRFLVRSFLQVRWVAFVGRGILGVFRRARIFRRAAGRDGHGAVSVLSSNED